MIMINCIHNYLPQSLQVNQKELVAIGIITSVALLILGTFSAAGVGALAHVGVAYGSVMLGIGLLVGGVSLYYLHKLKSGAPLPPNTQEELSDFAHNFARRLDLRGQIRFLPNQIQVNDQDYPLSTTENDLLDVYFQSGRLPPEGIEIHLEERTPVQHDPLLFLSDPNYTNLPKEMLNQIVGYLPVNDRLNFGACDTRNYKAAQDGFWDQYTPLTTTPEQLHSLLCIHGSKIKELDLSKLLYDSSNASQEIGMDQTLLFPWNERNQRDLLSLIPYYCPNLTSLTLGPLTNSYVTLLHFFPSLHRCPSLAHLRLEGLKTCRVDYRALAAVLPHLTSLKSLTLRNMSMNSESMQILGEGLIHLTSLQSIDFTYNTLGNDGLFHLANILPHLTSLTYLNLSNNYLTTEGIRYLVSAFPQLNKLGHLVIGNEIENFRSASNQLGSTGLQELLDGLSHLSSLKFLDLTCCRLGPTEMTLLNEKLPSLSGLKGLVLDYNDCCNDNYIGPAGMANLKAGLSALTNLEHLSLRGCQIDTEGARHLAEVLSQTRSLKYLDLQSNLVNSEGSRLLAEPLSQLTHLEYLNLGYNSIGEEGIQSLATPLSGLKALRHLNLGYNSLGDQGGALVSQILPQLTALTHLNLSRNCLKAAAIRQIAFALTSMNSLTSLDLSNNIFEEGIIDLAAALFFHASLTTLDLNTTLFGDDGMRILAPALSQLTSLKTLNLSLNRLSSGGIQFFLLIWPDLKKLETLNLGLNDLGLEGAQNILETAQERRALRTLDLSYIEIGPSAETIQREACIQMPYLNLNLEGNELGSLYRHLREIYPG